ncbi:prohibitin family protein [Clostridium sp.]|uniref:prohibitin family protein n=1 Tax=Clostridium sp. TaxID=1506 RepID=UPI0032169036
MKGKIGASVLGFILVVMLILGFACMEKIPNGYIGVVYSMNGGVEGETLTQGFHLVSPFKKVKNFTIANEQLILSKSKQDGSEDDDSFKVSTSDKANISVSFQMSYHYVPDTIVETYKRFRGLDGEDIVNERVKTVLKSKISEITNQYTMMDIYSGNRSEINNKITEYLNESFVKQFGIEVLDASIIDVHPDEQLEKSINDKVEAMQKAEQARQEQERVKVEAETKLIQAENDAAVKVKQAEAEAAANKKLSESITTELIQMKEAEARVKHGWIEIQGVSNAIVDTKDK